MVLNLKDINIFILIAVLGLGFLYNRYEEKLRKEVDTENYDTIQKYLLINSESLSKSKKPILWIHINYEKNSRKWISFGSRTSTELNIPFIHLCVKSIIKHCGESFKVCIIDDESFAKLLPTWSINMKTISSPILDNMRELGIAKIIHKYGGLLVPPSFLCFRDLIELYSRENGKTFVVENINRSSSSNVEYFHPDMHMMGAKKESPVIQELIQLIEHTTSSDYTAQTEFLGKFSRWCKYQEKSNKMSILDGKLICIKDKENDPILLENLMSDNYIDIYENAYGILIPLEELLKRRYYEWYTRMSEKQILESSCILSKYMLLATASGSSSSHLENKREGISGNHDKPNYVSFWRTPLLDNSKLSLGQNRGLYGMKPNMLGDNINKISNNNFLHSMNA